MTEYASWATHLLRLEQRAKRASELCEDKKWAQAVGEMTKMQAHLWNALYDAMKNDPRFFAETDN